MSGSRADMVQMQCLMAIVILISIGLAIVSNILLSPQAILNVVTLVVLDRSSLFRDQNEYGEWERNALVIGEKMCTMLELFHNYSLVLLQEVL